jgi:hypothetical protein
VRHVLVMFLKWLDAGYGHYTSFQKKTSVRGFLAAANPEDHRRLT